MTVDKTSHIASSAFLGDNVLATPVFAQGLVRSVDMTRVDRIPLASGYRASEMVGRAVTNGAKEVLGTIDDLILMPDGLAPFVALALSGFLGVDARLVVLPYGAFRIVDKHIVLPDATMASLTALPSFEYVA
jgi:hypothetical protein